MLPIVGCVLAFFLLAAGRTSGPAEPALSEGLTPLDQVHVFMLDQSDVVLPLRTQPIPGFDGVAVHVRQILQPIDDERGGDPFACAGCRAAGFVQRDGDFDDLFDFPLHGIASLRVSSICPLSPASRAGLSRLRSTRRAWP